MENDNNTVWVGHDRIVETTPIYGIHGRSFREALGKDYDQKTFGLRSDLLDASVLDLDSYESAKSPKERRETMDIAMGIVDYHKTRRSRTGQRILLVEFKLDCGSFDNIEKNRESLVSKDRHSRDILSDHKLEQKSVFLFIKDVASVAERKVNGWKKETDAKRFRHWEMLSPERFNKLVRHESEFPYEPITKLDDFQDELTKYIDNGDSEAIIKRLEYLKDIAEKYSLQWNHEEANHIASKVCSAFEALAPGIAEEDKDYISLIVEDIRYFLHPDD